MVGPVRPGIMIVGIVLGLAGVVRGDQAEPGALVRAAREASDAFKPIAAEEVTRAKADFASAVGELDQFLKGGGAAKVTGWKKYLLWDELAKIATAEGAPTEAQVLPLVDKLTANQTGLELTPFTRVRQTLKEYSDTARAANNTQLQDEYRQRLEKLAGHFEAYEKNLTSGDDAIAIAQTLGWLARSRQSPELLKAVRGAYYRPNVFGFMSRQLMAAGVEDDIDRVTPVQDNILGTSIHGTGRMRGRTTLVLDENPNAASYSVLLGGRVYSNNVGYNGPVTVYSTGVTSVSAKKSVSMTALGMAGTPTSAHCRTSSSINGISARHRLVERVAWKRSGEQKGQAEVIGSAHAQVRIAREMDKQSADLIKEQDDNYQNKFRLPLLRRGGFPEEVAFSSSSDRIDFKMMQAQAGQIAAPVAPPEHEAPHHLAVRAHESSVVNFAEVALGGTTMTDEQLVKIIRDDLKGEVPEELQITPDKDPWSITFARSVPFRAQFVKVEGKDGVKMALRGTAFTRGEQRINELIEISASYTAEKANGGAKLTRQGDVEVNYLERERLGATQVAFKTFLRRKFGAMFKPEMTSDGLQMKGRMAKVGKLKLTELKSDAAWIVLGWEMPTSTTGERVAAAE